MKSARTSLKTWTTYTGEALMNPNLYLYKKRNNCIFTFFCYFGVNCSQDHQVNVNDPFLSCIVCDSPGLHSFEFRVAPFPRLVATQRYWMRCLKVLGFTKGFPLPQIFWEVGQDENFIKPLYKLTKNKIAFFLTNIFYC